jgi:GMP synthase-like glutamine amidotransferase
VTRRALVFQHMDSDSPGRFGNYLMDDGFVLDTVMLGQGQAIPNLERYDFLMVLGGVMNVWEEDAHPWLRAEKSAIAEWMDGSRRPYLGICLGHQLLAETQGGAVGKSRVPEIGIHEVRLHESLAGDNSAGTLGERILVTQWHHYEVSTPPPSAVVIAESSVTPVQGIRLEERAIGLQFHAEWTLDVIKNWANETGHKEAYEEELGAGAHQKLLADAARMMTEYERFGRLVYDKLMSNI